MTAENPEPITQLELIALQRLYLDAKARGDAEAVASLKSLFATRSREFGAGRSLADIVGPIDDDGAAYGRFLASLDRLPPAPPRKCFAPRLSRTERESWLKANLMNGDDWTDDEILLAMGSGIN
ncbi:hypothetical protein [Demequina pelophila]|uniref:hypothetical protein n=1 Tax=Demequina pelophila TaxID=1638984 RepID=UPI000783BEA9|nr:hypothetical protein [Demequina pelophila]